MPIHSRALSLAHVFFFAFASLSIAGCFERSLQPVDPCTTSTQGDVVELVGVDSIDLVILVDDSTSMAPHQAALARQIPALVRALASGDRNHDGVQDFTPPRSLHIGIVSSDMGLGPITGVPSCDPGFGDDGVFISRASGCASGPTPRFLSFDVGDGQTADAFSTEVACVAGLGTGGCGIEFELEPILKALTPSSPQTWTAAGYVPPLFAGNTLGHGDDPTTDGGFLRPNSILGILTLNDEDDSSTNDFGIYSPNDSSLSSVELNVRPVAFADRLYPVQRYVDGFLGLRRQPGRVVYSTITGVPLELDGATPDAILADARMTPQIDPTDTQRLVAVCQDSMGGPAVPGRRMVEVASGLAARGAHASVHSICASDFSAAIDDLVGGLADILSATCLPHALNPDADGNVPCEVLELLPALEEGGAHCADLPNADAYTYVRTEVSSLGDRTLHRELCRIRQVGRAGAGVDHGWAYDEGTLGSFSHLAPGCGQRIALSQLDPINGAELRLQCTDTVLPSTQAPVQLGDFCEPSTGSTTSSHVACSEGHPVAGNPATLACDPFERTCSVACTTDADCTGAGLLSYVCDRRTALEVYGSASQIPTGVQPDAVHAFCVNPTCGDR
jgi:hypothetical protein